MFELTVVIQFDQFGISDTRNGAETMSQQSEMKRKKMAAIFHRCGHFAGNYLTFVTDGWGQGWKTKV